MPLGVSAETSLDQALDRFVAHLEACTKKFGYQNKKTSHLGDYELAPNEREWRQCAHEGITTLLVPTAEDPAPYEQIVIEDRIMTARIVAKTLTRSEREARLDDLIESTEELERKRRALQRARLRTVQQVSRAIRSLW